MVWWRITPHGQRSYWVFSIAEETKSKQGIVLVRGILETHWMSMQLLIRGFTSAMWT